MRKRITYANVAATLALVFSMSGGALAATHYLVTSTKQIKPSVLKKLKGNTGKTGATGKEGPVGKEGAAGKEGAPGKEGVAPATLMSGKSESGDWSVAGGSSTSGSMTTGVAFPEPLSSALDNAHVEYFKKGDSGSHCPEGGKADPGYLCVYANQENQAGTTPATLNESQGLAGADPFGFFIFLRVEAAGAYAYGSWTVTAP